MYSMLGTWMVLNAAVECNSCRAATFLNASLRAKTIAEMPLPLPPVDHHKIPLRATHNREGERPPRLNHRLVPNTEFIRLEKLEDVLIKLFGEMASLAF
jgi:hypothetical protein